MTVLTLPTRLSQSYVYHTPDAENPDEPQCYTTSCSDGPWHRKELDELDSRWRPCKRCSGEAEVVRATGTKLAYQLASKNVSPEDCGLSPLGERRKA
ncbi:hypothetical protein SAMN05421858_5088 [Haladaptatus litoreus]|uniref:Uncharacterized protein n=1 Tax=Haladaptatus litoreus TaxID=553468 RepID=A0A1N7FIA0_9EURY|nr:hypothetical protein [Haladaptatus litoreus]SIS00017.1 hypothetical protein SAMN05421858_5088 [Haladaptatus litoreus]